MKRLKMLFAMVVGILLSVSTASAAPILWIDDSAGNIGTVDVATGTTTNIGNSGQILTDIGFDPLGNLWGITFTNLYKISKTTGTATLVGSLGLNGANALVFGSDGTLYTAAFDTTNLYSVNTTTGAATSLGSDGFFSGGDLAFNGGNFYLASSTDHLIRLNLGSLATSVDVGAFGHTPTFGLATGSNGVLYGVAGTQIFSVNPATGAGTNVVNYSGNPAGLLGANGAASLTESVKVPEPATLALLGLGLAGLGFSRRRKSN